MARYTIRIELHGATWDDYVEMYKYLAAQGITDIITSDDGTRYKMPPAEYNYEGGATRDQVLASAKACAAKVVHSYAVLVTEAIARSWHSLAKA
ncbi:hypothetical protein NB688_002756 [Xanthomonas sacchari]|uniref:DUF2622 domain-containing protein n=1 Tax=Xanthomonas sacchari TaxID=56458 RepID=A0ABT3DVY6_9XANT|nr:hypothetical protein [Xanthomonas sacchari]MCW0399675.1 hypothetical protein [Xanthomonas sacchari]MCW0420590.1 hypothetical protein [Xanthomonas sacchari]UYK73972.1 hypothetical protein NG828_06515 [Xanthomonas sacchari]